MNTKEYRKKSEEIRLLFCHETNALYEEYKVDRDEAKFIKGQQIAGDKCKIAIAAILHEWENANRDVIEFRKFVLDKGQEVVRLNDELHKLDIYDHNARCYKCKCPCMNTTT